MTRALLVSIVDDDEGVRMATGGLVESFGYDVQTFNSGEAFLGSEWLDKTRCLIVDVQMPGITGAELHEHLLKSGKKIPVIFITAFPCSAPAINLIELDGDLGSPRGERLAGSQIKRHFRPAPAVDCQLERHIRFGSRIRCDVGSAAMRCFAIHRSSE